MLAKVWQKTPVRICPRSGEGCANPSRPTIFDLPPHISRRLFNASPPLLQQVEITPLAVCFMLQMLHQALNRLGLPREDAVDFDEEARHARVIAPPQLFGP